MLFTEMAGPRKRCRNPKCRLHFRNRSTTSAKHSAPAAAMAASIFTGAWFAKGRSSGQVKPENVPKIQVP